MLASGGETTQDRGNRGSKIERTVFTNPQTVSKSVGSTFRFQQGVGGGYELHKYLSNGCRLQCTTIQHNVLDFENCYKREVTTI